MALPKTRIGLEQIGYQFLGEGSCKYCGGVVSWFLTTHRNAATGERRRLCFHVEKGTEDAETRTLIPHPDLCPKRK